jgi:hypothetical protein
VENVSETPHALGHYAAHVGETCTPEESSLERVQRPYSQQVALKALPLDRKFFEESILLPFST